MKIECKINCSVIEFLEPSNYKFNEKLITDITLRNKYKYDFNVLSGGVLVCKEFTYRDKLNLNIELIPTKTWDETIELSQKRECDILSFLNETSKRKEWLVFTKPIFTDQNVLVGRAERKYIEDISKENLSIALPRNTAMSERFAKDFPNWNDPENIDIN